MRTDEDIDRAVSVVLASPTASFTTLVRLAGLDPKRSFRHAPLQGIDFSRLDLRGYDFRGADLSGCSFVGTKILGANFDKAAVDAKSLREAQDWKAYKEEQGKRSTADRKQGGEKSVPQITYDTALAAFRALLVSGRKLKPETISTMVNISPTFIEAAEIVRLSLRHRQNLSPAAVKFLASKVDPKITNYWLQKIISSNIKIERPKNEINLKIFLAVEMSNLIGHLNDYVPEVTFNRMLSDSENLGEILAIISFYEDRNWPISASTVQRLERKFADLDLDLPAVPSRNSVGTIFKRAETEFDYESYLR